MRLLLAELSRLHLCLVRLLKQVLLAGRALHIVLLSIEVEHRLVLWLLVVTRRCLELLQERLEALGRGQSLLLGILLQLEDLICQRQILLDELCSLLLLLLDLHD